MHERGIDISHETVRYWWNRFGPMFAAEIRRKRVQQMRAYSNWQWHLDEVFVKINGETHYLWRAVDHEGEVLESLRHQTRGSQSSIEIPQENNEASRSPSYPGDRQTPVLRGGNEGHRQRRTEQETGRWLNNRAENSHLPFRRRERAMQRFRSMRSLQKFAPFMPPSATISIWSVTSTPATISSSTEPPLSLSGAVCSA